MNLQASVRATAAAATALSSTGLALTGLGVLRNNVPHAVGGSCLVATGIAVVALILIRTWITDTSDARNALAAAQRDAEKERSRYFAAQAALENEQGRLRQEVNAEQQRIASILATEREAMNIMFEEKRAALVSETMEVTVRMFRNGDFAPDTLTTGRLIQFPKQEHQVRTTGQARSRGHEGVAP
ncbi:hypothetical protein DV517_61600 [Streptomyces sp. S816]|uniref:hypothetical protein n=1 Tax=Streptomyces sp. S816 TaxID=2283197 RepID=UPI00109CC2DE|nr:hypothetical protein [Streptomyces sp. S816]TGZ14677.1 hypothetical protein DV517_61600 [Streptomyces sp. S816]